MKRFSTPMREKNIKKLNDIVTKLHQSLYWQTTFKLLKHPTKMALCHGSFQHLRDATGRSKFTANYFTVPYQPVSFNFKFAMKNGASWQKSACTLENSQAAPGFPIIALIVPGMTKIVLWHFSKGTLISGSSFLCSNTFTRASTFFLTHVLCKATGNDSQVKLSHIKCQRPVNMTLQFPNTSRHTSCKLLVCLLQLKNHSSCFASARWAKAYEKAP